LHALLESLYEHVKGAWEDLFERRYGLWRGLIDGVVAMSQTFGDQLNPHPHAHALVTRGE